MGNNIHRINRVQLIVGIVFGLVALCLITIYAIKTSDKLCWNIVLNDGVEVEVRGYVFSQSQSAALEKKYNEFKEGLLESIQNSELRLEETSNARLRTILERLLQMRREELEYCTPSWDKWQYIVLSQIFLEGAKPSKYIATCRYEGVKYDLAFMLYSDSDLSDREANEALRAVADHLESLPKKEWRRLPVERDALFNENGDFATDIFDSFLGDLVFIEQD